MGRPRNPNLEELFFQGRRYTRKLKRRYFYCNEWDKQLKRFNYRAFHRDVWSATHGPIPTDCDIHHIDGDWDNNVPENFELITRSKHHQLHSNEPSFKRIMRAWHKRNGAKLRAAAVIAIQRPKRYVCQSCGKPFIAKSYKAKHCRRKTCVRERWRVQAIKQRQSLKA